MTRRLILVIAIAMAVSALAGCAHHRASLTPEQGLTTIRLQIVGTAKEVEDARKAGFLSTSRYTELRELVMEATRVYNSTLKRYEVYKTVAESDREKVIAILVSVAKAVAEARQKGGQPK